MRKRANSGLLGTELTAAIQLGVETAVAAVLQQQQPQNKPKKTTIKPPPPASELKQVAKATADPTKSSGNKRGFRGLPPPATFSLAELADDAWVTEYEVASLGRWSTNPVATWRKNPNHPLKWTTTRGGRVRYRVAAVREFLATGYRPQPGRPRKKPAPAPRRRTAAPRAEGEAAR